MGSKTKEKMKKLWLKMLKAYAKRKLEKAHKLYMRIVQLELEMKD